MASNTCKNPYTVIHMSMYTVNSEIKIYAFSNFNGGILSIHYQSSLENLKIVFNAFEIRL